MSERCNCPRAGTDPLAVGVAAGVGAASRALDGAEQHLEPLLVGRADGAGHLRVGDGLRLLVRVDVRGGRRTGEPLTVDEDHLVAWTEGLSTSRQRDGSIKSTMLGGEGYVTEFTGEGHVWLQTRNPLTLMGGSTGHEDDDDAGGPSVDDFI
jgi:hypothetical protein